MMRAAYRVHRLIQDLNRDLAAAEAFRANPEAFFEKYGLSTQERIALRDASPAALIALGVHPNLQMKYARVRTATPANADGPLAYYLAQLRGDS